MRYTHATWNASTFDTSIPGGGKHWRSNCFSCHTMILQKCHEISKPCFLGFSSRISGYTVLENKMFSSCILGFKHLKNKMFSSWILGQKSCKNKKLFFGENKNISIVYKKRKNTSNPEQLPFNFYWVIFLEQIFLHVICDSKTKCLDSILVIQHTSLLLSNQGFLVQHHKLLAMSHLSFIISFLFCWIIFCGKDFRFSGLNSFLFFLEQFLRRL